ncbi:hypothetical protein OAN307_c29710 [Octadecabacter antarcticus 307]|uniref:Uncharacterized protein n=1 Tax=Octadecabacter antarcticus 307 TaxID=391626 RepID=M9RDR0_9RHOB|nr:hypothetical protein [Octadecabacter antarcticus]AGI68521.1 hypothetical protein OAN307_c29710 [Octadecabacter antarcticus 307]
MPNTPDALLELTLALDRLETSRGEPEAFLDASKKLLDQLKKVNESDPDVLIGAVDVYKRLSQELVFAKKCAELRLPVATQSALQGATKY